MAHFTVQRRNSIASQTALEPLNISRAHLTALCIATKYNYDRNITNMGRKMNNSVIKVLEGEADEDLEDMVQHHQWHKLAIVKDVFPERFQVSAREADIIQANTICPFESSTPTV
ncbi:hypothetical protein EDD11_001744 [Mortierella claussenii]|nr:hypothetical protein EDD11_001744 [Mortierella claussenii]